MAEKAAAKKGGQDAGGFGGFGGFGGGGGDSKKTVSSQNELCLVHSCTHGHNQSLSHERQKCDLYQNLVL